MIFFKEKWGCGNYLSVIMRQIIILQLFDMRLELCHFDDTKSNTYYQNYTP